MDALPLADARYAFRICSKRLVGKNTFFPENPVPDGGGIGEDKVTLEGEGQPLGIRQLTFPSKKGSFICIYFYPTLDL